MTRQEQFPDTKFSEFSRWLRNNPWLNSKNGHTFVNVDFFCYNYHKKTIKIVEEKMYYSKRNGDRKSIPYAQRRALEMLYDMAKCYVETHPETILKGVHLIEFENTSPMDGGILINGKPVTESTLTAFMGDELSDDWYTSFHKQNMTEKERMDLKYNNSPYDFDIRRSNLVYNETEIDKDKIMTKVRPL